MARKNQDSFALEDEKDHSELLCRHLLWTFLESLQFFEMNYVLVRLIYSSYSKKFFNAHYSHILFLYGSRVNLEYVSSLVV